MAPRKRETLQELVNNTLATGNSVAVHVLEYLTDVKSPKHGFKDLAVEFLEASRAIYPAKVGLAEAQRTHTQFPADNAEELRQLLRQYEDNFAVLKQMVNRLLENEKKQGFSKFGRGFRGMFSENEVDKMRMSLLQCREAARKNALVFTWSFREGLNGEVTGIGYTALAAVLGRPTKSASETLPETPKQQPVRLNLDDAKSYNNHVTTVRELPLRELPMPKGLDSPLGLPHRQSSIGGPPSLASFHGASIGTFTTQTRSDGSHDDGSELTMPTTQSQHDEQFSHLSEDSMPKTAVRVKTDPAAVPRWRPKKAVGAVSQGSKTALLTAVVEQNHKMLEHLLDSGTPAETGPERNALIVAIANHDLDSFRLLLLFGADANAKDVDGLTPLYAATEMNFFEAAQLLLKYGADTNLSAGSREESPFAASMSDTKMHLAQLYLKHGATVNGMMENGETPFTQAMNKTASLSIIELLFVYEVDPNHKNSHGETALFKAINADRPDLVAFLLEHGADPNLPGPKHMLWPSVHKPVILELLLSKGANLKRAPGVLELASSTNSVEAVNILIKYGVDVNAKKDGIFTPLCTSIRDNHENLVEILLSAGADPNEMASEYPAWKCVTHHRTHILPRIIAAGADLNNPKGIIEMAVEKKNRDALILLLKHGVDPNARNAAGHTALTTAIRKADVQAIEILLSHGADPAVRGQEWPINMAVKNPDILAALLPHISSSKIPKGALELSVQADQLESVKSLLAKGVDVEEKNGGVFSPLTTAIREDRKAIFRYLLDEAGADPNSPGEHLPIIKAIRRHRENDMSYIKHLLAKGADINLLYRGWNAVLVALDKGDLQTLKLLAQMGTPDLSARNEDGQTVLELMQDRGMKEEERILVAKQRSSSPIVDQATKGLRDLIRE